MVIVGYGPCPDGALPVFSVADEKEAKALISLTCPMNYDHQYYAAELAEEQTLENLEAFSTRLDKAHDMLATRGNCRCSI